ncbi:DUF4365 domain-containing protein [Escherichia coli]|nr:DUF4365 domain-containing protein [Escherichia coli]
MIDKFPKYQKEAQLGELGVNIVKSVINENFGWIFKRNHQEMDFGIDGFIEIVRDDGAVTGKCLLYKSNVELHFFGRKSVGVCLQR